jgi:hypothetical protein
LFPCCRELPARPICHRALVDRPSRVSPPVPRLSQSSLFHDSAPVNFCTKSSSRMPKPRANARNPSHSLVTILDRRRIVARKSPLPLIPHAHPREPGPAEPGQQAASKRPASGRRACWRAALSAAAGDCTEVVLHLGSEVARHPLPPEGQFPGLIVFCFGVAANLACRSFKALAEPRRSRARSREASLREFRLCVTQRHRRPRALAV